MDIQFRNTFSFVIQTDHLFCFKETDLHNLSIYVAEQATCHANAMHCANQNDHVYHVTIRPSEVMKLKTN